MLVPYMCEIISTVAQQVYKNWQLICLPKTYVQQITYPAKSLNFKSFWGAKRQCEIAQLSVLSNLSLEN